MTGDGLHIDTRLRLILATVVGLYAGSSFESERAGVAWAEHWQAAHIVAAVISAACLAAMWTRWRDHAVAVIVMLLAIMSVGRIAAIWVGGTSPSTGQMAHGWHPVIMLYVFIGSVGLSLPYMGRGRIFDDTPKGGCDGPGTTGG